MKRKRYEVEYEKQGQVIRYVLEGTNRDLNLEILYRKSENCKNIKIREVQNV